MTEWPPDWEERKRGKACPMCAAAGADDTAYGIRFFTGRFGDAYIQKRARVRGHVVVSWNGRHVAEPTELTTDEANGYWQEVLDVAKAVDDQYRPLKLNIEMLGNSTPHLHAHVRPRYADDGAPMGPLPHSDGILFPDSQLRADADALRMRLAR
jgi:diadenosine tetraphosphate (Ap4A) HIT family hydrolase